MRRQMDLNAERAGQDGRGSPLSRARTRALQAGSRNSESANGSSTGTCASVAKFMCGPVLHPDGKFRSVWNILLAFLIICAWPRLRHHRTCAYVLPEMPARLDPMTIGSLCVWSFSMWRQTAPSRCPLKSPSRLIWLWPCAAMARTRCLASSARASSPGLLAILLLTHSSSLMCVPALCTRHRRLPRATALPTATLASHCRGAANMEGALTCCLLRLSSSPPPPCLSLMFAGAALLVLL